MVLTLPAEWVAHLPTDRPVGVADLGRLPEGPPHPELIDGVLIVPDAPRRPHATVVDRLTVALDHACPAHLQVAGRGLEWVVDDRTLLLPDLMVVDPGTVDPSNGLDAPPLLVVEVLSPATRCTDLVDKRRTYARGGCRRYWIVDPVGPWLLALELTDQGTYRAEADLGRRQALVTTDPFAFRIEVSDLAGHDG